MRVVDVPVSLWPDGQRNVNARIGLKRVWESIYVKVKSSSSVVDVVPLTQEVYGRLNLNVQGLKVLWSRLVGNSSRGSHIHIVVSRQVVPIHHSIRRGSLSARNERYSIKWLLSLGLRKALLDPVVSKLVADIV